MAPNQYPLLPHNNTYRSSAIRKIYIQNLTDCLHVCLLRGELERARRAWAILIRCREVNWRSRWYWGLHLLSSTSSPSGLAHDTATTQDADGRQIERWLGSLRISGHETEKPALLLASVLHLIKHNRHQDALDQLETYLPSYPFLLSGPLHTYAGMLSFYLAQPLASRRQINGPTVERERQMSIASSTSHVSSSADKTDDNYLTDSSSFTRPRGRDPANPSLMNQAKAYFSKARSIDPNDEVAAEFIQLIDNAARVHDDSDGEDEAMNDVTLEKMDENESSYEEGKDDGGSEVEESDGSEEMGSGDGSDD